MTDLNPSALPSFPHRLAAVAAVLALVLAIPAADAQQRSPATRPQTGDYIVAVINQELVTAGELESRLARVREDAARNKQALPPAEQLRKQVLDLLIDERVQITYARENGSRLDEAELDRAVTNVAVQNQLTLAQLRDKLRQDGLDYTRFRNNVRDQLMTERVREREVIGRIRITDAEIDAFLDKRRAEIGAAAEYNIAQILVNVPEGASAAVLATRRARAEAALARIKAGEAFEAVAREVSEDAKRADGGVIGLRPADRLPDLFMAAVRPLKPGEVAPALVRSGAGFHVLKLVDKQEAGVFTTAQTRARHILLRPSAQLPQDVALRRLADMKRQIESGARTFEQLARENSEDGSAPQGGDLGWVSAGAFVPEFEDAMNALPVSGLSEPIMSRFGAHLIQVVDRRQVTLDPKQQREQARSVLREQKYDETFADWIRELRARAYIEMREPPQ
jgi:peptidyl-prolyl cis-trans isomerase SurA